MSLSPNHRAARRRAERLARGARDAELRGDLRGAAVLAHQFVDALEHLDRHETHVIVGDHAPEPRREITCIYPSQGRVA